MKKRFLFLLMTCFITAGNVIGRALNNSENLGSFSSPFSVTRGVYPSDYAEPFTSYYFTLTNPMDVIISQCESTSDPTTGIFLSDMNGTIIASDTGGRIECVDGHAYVIAPYLLPGTYKIDIDWPLGTGGNVYTKVEGLSPLITRSAKEIGEFYDSFNYVDTKDTREPYVGYQGDNAYKNSVCYSFYISCNMDIRISHCGSENNHTTLSLLDGQGNRVTGYQNNSEEIVCENPDQARLGALNLPQGMYYVVSQGTTQKGRITTRITGTKTVPVPPITELARPTGVISDYDPLFVFEDKQDTSNPNIGYQGYNNYRDGVCYRFRLSRDMDVEISHCGSRITDTEVYLLDKDGNRLSYNDNYSGVNACDEYQHAHLELPSLAAGTYYVVSVGKFGEKGEISTRIICKEPERSMGSQDKNYILTRSYLDAFGADRLDKIDYFDEMGRKEQTILVEASPLQDNLATLIEYDTYGRLEKSWLQTEYWTVNGGYISPEALKARIRTANYNDEAPYSLTEYESSPLNRAVREYGPGYDWHSKGKAVRAAYQLTNIAGNDSLNCIHYYIRGEAAADTFFYIHSSGNRPTGTLDAIWKADEDGNTVIEFKNRFGQVVLSRQIVKGGTRTFYDTYYIYDDWGNLCTVLPPKASDHMKTPNGYWNSNTESCLRDYAYIYKYDKRFRLIAKRLPGQDWMRYVYDKCDSPVFVQDSEQRKRGEWSFTISDGLGRVCLTGICKNYFEWSQSSFNTVVKALRDNRTGMYKGYSLSGVTLVDANVLTVNYYDDYSFMGTNGIPAATHVNYRYDHLDGYGEQNSNGARSLLTGTLTAQLDTSNPDVLNYIPTVMYYDYRGRLIQRKGGSHFPDGIEQEYIAYNFAGNPVKRKQVYSLSGEDAQTEEYIYTYDRAGRLLVKRHSLNGAAFTILNDNAYDGTGRLISDVCRYENRDVMETCYAYNVRSWITSIHNSFFNQRLYYNDFRAGGTNMPCYNGNISGMDWEVSADRTPRGYNFTYDGLSRLTRADYLEQQSRKSGCFDTSYEYDKHGNPLRIKRYGQTGANSYGLIDDLYITLSGNQLKSVDNVARASAYNGGAKFKDGTSQAIEYSYDANGRLKKDSNKDIVDIQYNLLDLPNKILFSGGRVISYVYDANGAKRRTTHRTGNTTTVIDYCGNAIYENGSLSKILTENGYISLSGTTPTYHYYLKDHLGNNRVVINQHGNVEETNHYYPFGGTFGQSGDVQPYKYNGKELDGMFGLNLYDYSARQMEPTLGRFTTMDPLAEKYYSVSPYVYCGNNPVRITDPTGMDWWNTNDPDEIERLLLALRSGQKIDTESLGNQWTRVTDKEVIDGIAVFDDVTNDFTINGESYTNFQGYGAANGMSMYGLGSISGATLGFVGANFELSNSTFRLTRGAYYGYPLMLSPKLYTSGWNGGSRAQITTYRLANLGKVLGTASAAMTFYFSAKGIYEYKTNPHSPNAVHPTKAGLDIGMAGYALIYSYVGAAYFLIDSTIGWEPVLQASVQARQEHKMALGTAGNKWWAPKVQFPIP